MTFNSYNARHEQAIACLSNGDYETAAKLYEQAIEIEPEVNHHYWYLGVSLLLHGREEEAQIVWQSGLEKDGLEWIEQGQSELLQVLITEAEKHERKNDWSRGWLLRMYIHDSTPEDLQNLFQLIIAADKAGVFASSKHLLLEAINLLRHLTPTEVAVPFLLPALKQVLAANGDQAPIAEFAQACLEYYQVSISNYPKSPELYCALGNIYAELDREQQAIAAYHQALDLKPDDAESFFALGNLDLKVKQYDLAMANYLKAIAFNPSFTKAYVNIAFVYEQKGNIVEAIKNLEIAVSFKEEFAPAYRNLASLLFKSGRASEAVPHALRAIEIQPDYISAYLDLYQIMFAQNRVETAKQILLRIVRSFKSDPDVYWRLHGYFSQVRNCLTDEEYKLWQDATLFNCHFHGSTDPIRTDLAFIVTYLFTSTQYEAVMAKFLGLEAYLLSTFEANAESALSLYFTLNFWTPSIRDDLPKNAKLLRDIGSLYVKHIIQPSSIYLQMREPSLREVEKRKNLRIGFLSPNFYRHATNWTSGDIICALSQVTPHIFLYGTDCINADDRTELLQQAVERFYGYDSDFGSTLGRLIDRIHHDDLDILIDLDSSCFPRHAQIFYARPTTVQITWNGFDAPFLSKQNYFLGDWHTHPQGSEIHYCERLFRMPNCYTAISGFDYEPIDRLRERKQLGIDPEQIVFMFGAPPNKLNPTTVRAQIEILKHVPNGILIYKGLGYRQAIQSLYSQECELQGVDFKRIHFSDLLPTVEMHRAFYTIGDVLLDSYPFNGGVHSLEALWMELPLITLAGSQFMSRLGLTYLNNLGVDTGISHNWQEYVEWGIRYGQDKDLRNAVCTQLATAKKTESLSPLWDPTRFAKDMYALLCSIVENHQST
ncbi:tetratricopeptide repeat protein [Tumidithrix elongata RA019]|uniref:protein O-GlcNAc transferase n=1 Tax=Tumidithrix elongata BACA0141 TaxID=2716417 RepID=A0AAW9Q7W6_9CYAN|nr:tetratricopeptide repeat protein [Tumidithrix elongata RA019]